MAGLTDAQVDATPERRADTNHRQPRQIMTDDRDHAPSGPKNLTTGVGAYRA